MSDAVEYWFRSMTLPWNQEIEDFLDDKGVETRAVLNQFRIQVKLLTGCLLTATVIPVGHLTLIV